MIEMFTVTKDRCVYGVGTSALVLIPDSAHVSIQLFLAMEVPLRKVRRRLKT